MNSKSRFTKIAVAAGLVVTSGAAVLGLTGFASAQQAHREVVSVASVADDATQGVADLGTLEGSVSANAIDGPVSGVVTATPETNRPNPLAVAAKALGITEAELKTELESGKSIADVAKAKGVDLADVKKALLADLKAHLDEEVKSGEHTQAEADAKYAEMTSRIDTMLTTAGLPHGPGGHGGKGGHGGHGGPRFATDAVAKSLKLSATELQTQLKSGKTLADIATAQNVDIADVKAALTADFKAHLDEEVKSGEHTQAEADAKLAEFKTRLDDMVNGVRPAGGPMGGHRGHGEFRGQGGMDMGGPAQGSTGSSQAQGAAFSA